MNLKHKFKILFVVLVLSSHAHSYQFLYAHYGYSEFYKPEIVARYPFVHALALHLHQAGDNFVCGVLNLFREVQYYPVVMQSLINLELDLQSEWINQSLINDLKERLYPHKWWEGK
ncbi:hypothetical protein [Endozoicomonas euniceicola]|uniref:Uncharacterized protein n=1 Tax=Endozoicomonas euniceicola TaxID=1234143 RepID=A0ABY6GTB1_9GAMM|nr:hypothetical protein [Endozoicomonas euniceicola]UYM16008.1 hypothetical protein NX720_24890 [Endozoicomonas euniceicola]